jgi:hypothetical protein
MQVNFTLPEEEEDNVMYTGLSSASGYAWSMITYAWDDILGLMYTYEVCNTTGQDPLPSSAVKGSCCCCCCCLSCAIH